MHGVRGVQLDVYASTQTADAVRAVFNDWGVDVPVQITEPDEEAIGDGAFWAVVVIVMAVGPFFKGFMEEMGKQAATSAAEKIRAWWQDVRAARRPSVEADPNGAVDVRDSDQTIVLIGDHPLEAYERLLEVNWSENKGRMLAWDDDRREWRDLG